VKLGIRPEHITLCSIDEAHCTGTVEFAEYLGSDTFLYVNCANLGTLTVRTQGALDGVKDKEIGLLFNEQLIHLFDQNEQVVLI